MLFPTLFFNSRGFSAELLQRSQSDRLSSAMAIRQAQRRETRMDRDELEANIAAELATVKNTALNRNAISALFGAFGDPVGALGKIFLGRDDAVDAEKHKIERSCILDLLCDIDEALKKMHTSSASQGVTIAGLVEADGTDVDKVVAIHIQDNSPTVHFGEGSVVRAKASGSGSLTALLIGGSAPKGDK